jgi:NCS1 family nucleobase:cation symporter-1
VGLVTEPAARSGRSFNVAVMLAWLIPVAVAFWIYKTQGINSFMLPLPCWLVCGLLYIAFSKLLKPRTA